MDWTREREAHVPRLIWFSVGWVYYLAFVPSLYIITRKESSFFVMQHLLYDALEVVHKEDRYEAHRWAVLLNVPLLASCCGPVPPGRQDRPRRSWPLVASATWSGPQVERNGFVDSFTKDLTVVCSPLINYFDLKVKGRLWRARRVVCLSFNSLSLSLSHSEQRDSWLTAKGDRGRHVVVDRT